MGVLLKQVEYLSMMEVSVGEYPVHSSANRSQFGYTTFLDGDPAWKVLVAVE